MDGFDKYLAVDPEGKLGTNLGPYQGDEPLQIITTPF